MLGDNCLLFISCLLPFVCPHSAYAMEGKASSRGDSLPEYHVSVRSGSGDLIHSGVGTHNPSSSVQGRVSPVHSVSGYSRTDV